MMTYVTCDKAVLPGASAFATLYAIVWCPIKPTHCARLCRPLCQPARRPTRPMKTETANATAHELRDTEEAKRLAAIARGADWRRWGPYVAERQWGAVREDYSADGDAWRYFPFEQA